MINLESEIKKSYKNNTSLGLVYDKFGFAQVISKLFELYSKDELKLYIFKYCKKQYVDTLEIMSLTQFHKDFFNGKNMSYFKYTNSEQKEFHNIINSVYADIIELSKKEFLQSNVSRMNLSNQTWRLFFIRGSALNKRDFYFYKINNPQLRKEVMMYFAHILRYETNFRNERGLAGLTVGLNLLTVKFPEVKCFKDINKYHLIAILNALQAGEVLTENGTLYSIASIRKIIKGIGLVSTYLMNLDKYALKPSKNPAESISFRNTEAFEKNTEIIPDEIMIQLDHHYKELNPDYKLMYEILSATGLRIKSVTHLQINCLTPCKEDGNYYVLEYNPFKTAKVRKKNGQAEMLTVLIEKELAIKIKAKIKNNLDNIKKSGTDFIFVSQLGNTPVLTLTKEYGFVQAVNRIIKKHNIVNADGSLWNYTSRQARKTLGVNLAENGATSQQIANQFGHNDTRTTDKYYAEVRTKKMAELNSSFFQKKFNLFVGEDNLKNFTEEERKLLYIDFIMNVRNVELGKCSKHISEGPCGVNVGRSNCAICPKLCTGTNYLPKWEELHHSQLSLVSNLIRYYEQKNITDYENFIEFKREMVLLTRYQNVINQIKGV